MKQKLLRRLLAICLCVVLAFGCFGLTGTASVGDTYVADAANWGTQNNNGWYYLYKTVDGSYHEMDYYDSSASISWQQNAFASDPYSLGEMFFITQSTCFVGENGTKPVYAFVAPETGNITLRLQTHSTTEMHMQVYVERLLQKINGEDSLTLNRTGTLPGAMTLTELNLSVVRGQTVYVEFYSTNTNVQRQAWVNEYSATYTSISETVQGMTFAPTADNWGVQNNNGWYYMYKSTGGTYGLLDYYAASDISWQQNAFAFDPGAMGEMLFINQNSFFTGENGSLPVYAFAAPATGTVRLSFETHGTSSMGVRVLHNRRAVSVDGGESVTFNTNGYTAHTVELSVQKNDKIYLEGFTTGEQREGWLRNYSVTYLTAEASDETDTYAPDLDINWGVQDNNGWYYLYQNLLTDEYLELPYIASGTEGENYTNCFSAHRVFPYCFISQTVMHPGTAANAVKAFCAPSGGRVTFELSVQRTNAVVSGSPSLLRVKQGNRQIFPADGSAYELTDTLETLSIEADVAQGDWVYFVLSCDGSNVSGEVQMTERAVYSEKNDAVRPENLPVPAYEGFQIRENETDAAKKDLRFTYSLTAQQFGVLGTTENYQMYELGTIWQKASVLGDKELNENSGIVIKADYLDDSTAGELHYTQDFIGIAAEDFAAVYCVRPYVKLTVGDADYVFYGDTSEASVLDYLSSDSLAYGTVTDPVSINMSTGAVTSVQGSLTVTPQYIAKSNWHSTRNVYSVSSTGNNSARALASGGSIDISVSAMPDGGVSVTQTANVTSGGIGGIGLGISFSMDYDVILPAWGGVRLTREMPDAAPFPNDSPRSCIQYPTEWDAQMFLIQGEHGGWLVYQDDNGGQFKNLWLGNDGTNFNFVIETVPQAPYSAYTTFTACPWNIVAYEGDWTVGAALYKEFADDKFGIDEIKAAKPEWVDEIQTVVLTDLTSGTMPMLRELANEVDASKVILLVPGWRADLYDVNYPDYTAAAGLKNYIDEVHALGYKVMVHANLIGCDDTAEEYTDYGLADDRYLSDRTGEPILESWTTSYSVDFWLINPASPDWQDLLVSRLVEVYNTLGVDGFHLDQSLLAYNDNRGYVNGKTSMQGVVELERKLAEALPNCVFSGEGTNECNSRYASFLQRAPYGINSAVNGSEWSTAKINQIVPLDTLLWSGNTHLYHYAAMPPSGSEASYLAWCKAGIRLGALPTLMRSSAYELLVPNLATQTAISLINWYQDNQPVIDYSRWNGDTEVIAFRTENGQSVELTTAMIW